MDSLNRLLLLSSRASFREDSQNDATELEERK